MRIIFLLTIIFIIKSSLFAQLIDLKKPWISQEPFFDEESLVENDIQAIHLRIRDKKDGEIMSPNSTFIHFLYNENGKVISSFQSIPLSNRIDTSRISYSYDEEDNCIERIEKRGEFSFKYLLNYNNENELYNEVKLDIKDNRNDTLYIRFYKSYKTKTSTIQAVLNESKKEFMSYNYSYKDGKLVKEIVKFVRNQNRVKRSYFYKGDKILERTYAKNYGNKKFEKWNINYDEDRIDLISVYENGEFRKKIKFSYSNEGKLTAIIERDFKEESIRLIEISYYYF